MVLVYTPGRRDTVYVHFNLRLADKLQDISHSKDNVPWSEPENESDSESST